MGGSVFLLREESGATDEDKHSHIWTTKCFWCTEVITVTVRLWESRAGTYKHDDHKGNSPSTVTEMHSDCSKCEMCQSKLLKWEDLSHLFFSLSSYKHENLLSFPPSLVYVFHELELNHAPRPAIQFSCLLHHRALSSPCGVNKHEHLWKGLVTQSFFLFYTLHFLKLNTLRWICKYTTVVIKSSIMLPD